MSKFLKPTQVMMLQLQVGIVGRKTQLELELVPSTVLAENVGIAY